jgi:O-antigen biosynthesis protein
MIDKVVVMMVTYNRLELTKQTIDALLPSTKYPFDLVIVDNGSKDGTVEYLQQLSIPNLHLNLLVENKGIAVGRNIALKMADDLKAVYYCTIDNDVKLPQNWLEDCLGIIKANKNYSIGVNFEPSPYPLVTKNGWTFQHKPAGNLGTALTVFSKQLHQMIGFFNTEYNKYGLEDSDFFMRARVAGFQLGYLSEMGIHLGADENDTGEYRKFKTQQHDSLVHQFRENCSLYANRRKSIYFPYKE